MASRRELRALITIAGRIDPSLQSAMVRASGQSARLARSTQQTASGLNRVTGAMAGQVAALAGSLAAVLGVQKIIDTADAWTTVRARVGLVTNGIKQQQESLDAVYAIAQKTKQSYEVTGDLYAKIAMNAKQLGLANGQVLQITDTVNKALRIGGGTTEQSKAAIMQFSQALASGRLQGDELRSILENAPRLARAVADGLGVTVGSLKKFGSEGALTADVIIKALHKQGKVIDQEYSKMPVTIRGAFTYFDNAFGKFVDNTGKQTNIFNRISSGIIKATDLLFISLEKLSTSKAVADSFTTLGNSIQWTRDNSNWLIPAVAGVAGSMTALRIISTVTGLYRAWTASTFAVTWAQHGLNAALRSNPIGIAVTAIGLLVAGGVALWKNWDTIMAKGRELWAWIGKVAEPIKNFFGYGEGSAPGPAPVRTARGIRGFATGGIATRASIFGEAGPEMAIPLQRTPRSIGLLQQTATIMGVRSGGSNTNNISVTVNITATGGDPQQIASVTKGAVIDILETYFEDKGRFSFV